MVAKEITGDGKEDPKRLVMIEDELFKSLLDKDEVMIEGFPFDTQKAITAGMYHGGLRSMIYRRRLAFNEVAPNAVKKYVGVTGWVGEVGKKRRLKDKEKKAAVKDAVLQHFCYTHKSDNVIDAYIIARIAWSVYLRRELHAPVDTLPYQLEVIKSILEPEGR